MDYGAANTTPDLKGDEGIVQEASERWKACKDFQGVEDERTREDIKFANGDSRNAWQWPTKIYQERTAGSDTEMPCLTINSTRVHNDLVINSICKNKFAPKVRPTGGKSSYESAKVMESLFRRIQYISKYSTQKRKVVEQVVDGGISYILIEARYVSEKSFDQDLYLRASRDPTAVYLDPWCREPDGSDAAFGFIFDLMPRKEFNRKYPRWKDKVGAAPIDSAFSDWMSDKAIMLCRYYRKRDKSDTLVSYKHNGEDIEKLASEIRDESGKDIFDDLMAQIKDGTLDGKTRKVTNNEIEWFLIAGDTIIDRGDWAGKYIPICRCVGRELIIDRTLDRKGLTRQQIDAQRMLNYNASMAVQDVAIQTKAPWLAPARAIEGQEGWKTANIDNFAVLLWNDVDDEADGELQKIPPPQKIDRPAPSPAYEAGMQTAERHLMMVTGQFQAQMGENDTQSAASGKAINERQQQGDTATYHFVEHTNDMEVFIGVQLLDLIPKYYDNRRTLHVIDTNNDKRWIQIDPNQVEAVQMLESTAEDEEAVKLAFNPSVGEYECISDPGPDYATQRQEAWNAMSLIMQQNKELSGACADLLFKYGDFPGADEIMERLQKEIKQLKPYLFDDVQSPQLIQLQQENARLVALHADLIAKLANEKLKGTAREERNDVKAYDADTHRLKVQFEFLSKMLLTPQQKAQMEHDMEAAFHQHVYGVIESANEADLAAQTAAGKPNGSAQ